MNYRNTIYLIMASLFMFSCGSAPKENKDKSADNPFMSELNAPIDYASATADDLKNYANSIFDDASKQIEEIKNQKDLNFENLFVKLDGISNELNTASNQSFMLYWVSPDSLTRAYGIESYQKLNNLSTSMSSDKAIYNQLVAYTKLDEYNTLSPIRKKLVDDVIKSFKNSGVSLSDADLKTYKQLNKEITELSAQYSNNMNSANMSITITEAEAAGLPENFKNTYKTEDGKYKIPVMNATARPVLNNAASEDVRKKYYMKFNNIAADKNIDILKQLVQKRYQLAKLMGFNSYAGYYLDSKMAKNPTNVWNFVNDLVDKSKGKAKADMLILKDMKKNDANATNKKLNPWDISYYENMILKNKYNVDHEKIREYLPMKQCLKGVLDLYQQLLGYEFKKIENPKVWHPEVEMYEVYQDSKLVGRFYLDLFPRPNKESWFYGVGITTGKAKKDGYEIPSSMLLGNFTRPTDELPSLLSHKELNTLFHEFGHILDAMSYKGEFSMQSSAKSDFIESMSQIFENWTMDYETLTTFAKHYKTGEVLPKELFDNMQKAKNVSSGIHTLGSLRRCVYDLNLYDKYNPEKELNTDQLWKDIDAEFGVESTYVEGTHPQAAWIHINTHPVYYYGYLWSEVYAQDMFTIFEKNGLTDNATGVRFRDLILANGSQEDAILKVEEFLGRPSNNKAYIKSLGLE